MKTTMEDYIKKSRPYVWRRDEILLIYNSRVASE